MIGRTAMAAIMLGCIGSGAVAQPAAAPAPAIAPPSATTPLPVPKPATVRVLLQTAAGPIVLELEKERAPITTANFLRYVDGKRFDGVSFYRAVRVQAGYGLLQGGVGQSDARRLLPPIAHEPTTRTGLSNVDGAIGMGRNAPGTATADFYIVVGGFPSMDADPKASGDNQGFAVFGHVAEGMDIVRRLLAAPTSPDAGPPGMKGQMLVAPVKIVTARRVAP